MDLPGLRALVTGANGNVGSVVAARLAREGARVRAMVRGATPASSGETVRADLADAAARGLAAVILRPALITSMHPRSRWGPQAIEKAATSPDSILPFPEIPHVHVDNLAQAVVLAATRPAARGRAYNVVDRAAP